MILDLDTNVNKLCIECEYHRHHGFDQKCHHPKSLSNVDGTPRYSCYEMRYGGSLMYVRCCRGCLFVERKLKETEPKKPWYLKFFRSGGICL